ncbi:MAG TPA: hypothetical protein VFI46_13725 [Jiangellaceae bacterium]|nr:hypothetical protein [Jiangellaceae bacterium]
MTLRGTLCHTWLMEYDRALIGHVVAREIERRYGRLATFLRRVPDLPSRRTIERVMNADPLIEHRTLRRIEGGLGLPRDFLVVAVANHDVADIRAASIDPDLRRWVLTQIGEAPPLPRQDHG